MDGRLPNLYRRGRSDALIEQIAAAQYDDIDDLVYAYKLDEQGNRTSQIDKIKDEISGPAQQYGYSLPTGTYTYDLAGNVTSDGLHGLGYNAFNLPTVISANSDGDAVSNVYQTNGSVFKRFTDDQTRYYLHGLIIEDGEIRSYEHANGRVTFEEDDEAHFQYKLADHLGNTVVLFEDRDGDGYVSSSLADPATAEVLQRELYYPFGLPLRGTVPIQPTPTQDFLYNGKEDVWGSGLLDYGARMYDPTAGRWLGVDPLADRYGSVSPYNYVLNNPMLLVDPDGRMPKGCCGDTPYPVRKAMGQLQSQLTGLKDRAVGAYKSIKNFVVDNVVGNDDISNVATSLEQAGDAKFNPSASQIMQTVGKEASKVGTILTVAEGVKIFNDFDSEKPESVQDAAKFTLETAAGAAVPAVSIPLNFLIRDARREGGLTNPKNHERLSGAYSSSFNQTKAGNMHLQKALQQQKKQSDD
ncbi:MAG: RHS repeat-associated core domain-containing protein [Saprospiraceae bacterium]